MISLTMSMTILSKDAIDDDVDVNEPFMNMYSELDPDIDVELDEEEDEQYLIVED